MGCGGVVPLFLDHRDVVHMGEMTNVYKILFGKLKGKKLLRRPRHRCEHNINMYLIGHRVEVCGLD
jgi:hypothetical protein